MLLLILGLALWFAAHGLKIHAPARRATLVEMVGEMPVKAVMALALVGSVALMVMGYQQADYIETWGRPGWAVHLTNLAMVFALAIYLAGPIPSRVRHWVRHPQVTGVKIWAVAHLIVNGDVASAVLFGGLLLWAVAAMVGINRRDGKGPKPGPGSMAGNIIHLVVTLAVFAGVSWVHNYLGVWPFPG